MTLAIEHDAVHFRPSRVEGAPDVDKVRVGPDRLELRAGGAWRTILFLSFAPGREIATGRVPVGELHFSKSHYPDSHFVFYTTPRIAIYMPADGPTDYPDSIVWRVQEVVRQDGFFFYEGNATPPRVLKPPSLRWTVLYVLAVLAVSWLYGLSGFLPGRSGEIARDFLLSNPRNPAIGLAFMLLATLVPMVLAFAYGRTARALAWVVGGCYVLAMTSEWALRRATVSWAPLETPPYDLAFWSSHRWSTMLIIVSVVSVVATMWRRSFLEPVGDVGKA